MKTLLLFLKKMKKENSRTNYIVIALLVLVIGISIGYAALSTTLNINGSTTIGKSSWDVHFANVIETAGGVTATKAAAITAGQTTEVTYEVTLPTPGTFYEFTVDVVNAGSLDAKLSADATVEGVSAAQAVYTKYSVVWSDTGVAPKTGDVITAGQKKTAKVRVEYNKDVTAAQLPTTDQVLTLTASMNFIQA